MNEGLDVQIRKLLYASSCEICCCKCHCQPTVFDPMDVYLSFLKGLDICAVFGIHGLEDVENHVIKTYKKEYWPKYLQKKYQ